MTALDYAIAAPSVVMTLMCAHIAITSKLSLQGLLFFSASLAGTGFFVARLWGL